MQNRNTCKLLLMLIKNYVCIFFFFFFTVRNARRQLSDIRKTFIKYCIVGWGLPAVVVVLGFVLDFTETFHFGYGL